PITDPNNYWANYVRMLVGHFRGRIHTWIFYNEPDIYVDPDDWQTFAGPPSDYAQVLKVGYLAAKSVDPTIQISVAGLTYFWDKENNRAPYLQRLLDALATDPDAPRNNWYFDLVMAHTYANP